MFEKIDRDFVLPTYARNYVNFVSGDNATLKDSKNREYIDFTSGIGVVSVGHANKEVNRAICKQIDKITHISNLFLIEPQAKLAQRLVKLSGYDMRVFFSNSGAEANEGAIKIARKYGERSGRYKIITLNNSFHGRTIATLKATAQESFHKHFFPFPDGFVYAKSVDEIVKMIDDETVAVMIELIQGEGGVEDLDRKRIKELEVELKRRDILLIVDEVQTGVYRTGEFLASNLYEIKPDIITLAKGLGGGVPIGAVMTSKKDIFSAGDHGSTYGGNYLVTTAALSVLDILEELKKSGKLDESIDFFEKNLTNLASNYPHIIDKIVGSGLMRGFRIKSGEILSKIIQDSFENGLLVLKAGQNTLRFLPPLTITKEEIELGFKKLDSTLGSL